MKVYVVHEDWATRNGGSGSDVLGLYENRKQAERALKRAVRQAKKDEIIQDDWEINLNDDCYYEAYMDGWYDEAHYRVRIEYLEVKKGDTVHSVLVKRTKKGNKK